jgi:hypothetical protein
MSGVATVAKGDGSGVTSPRRVLIRDDQAWRALWTEHAGVTAVAPAVDFSAQMVAAVFAGDRPTPGHGVEVVEARRHGDQLEILVKESRPSTGVVLPQLMTSPFHIVTLPRFDGEVSFGPAS